ncbi:MAG TPA: AMP-dependent synthetase, partial [Rhodospirillaceae bacterium]|nr:AMP-dependent synthetase [Rhodospirillaceae bacterium]
MPDNPHYDDQETRAAEAREATLFEALRARLAQAKAKAPYYREVLSDIDPAGITDRAALARLPVTRKSELVDRQAPGHTLGGLTTVPDGRLRHIYQSPGPTYDADGQGADWWRMARGL